MITVTREFDSYEEAQEAFGKAHAAYYWGYGFYPKRRGDLEPDGDEYIGRDRFTGKWTFTYCRGESCD